MNIPVSVGWKLNLCVYVKVVYFLIVLSVYTRAGSRHLLDIRVRARNYKKIYLSYPAVRVIFLNSLIRNCTFIIILLNYSIILVSGSTLAWDHVAFLLGWDILNYNIQVQVSFPQKQLYLRHPRIFVRFNDVQCPKIMGEDSAWRISSPYACHKSHLCFYYISI